jgi:NitT/TauT family transport system substrate-binding protein
MMARTRVGLLGLASVLLVAAAACGSSAKSSKSAATTPAPTSAAATATGASATTVANGASTSASGATTTAAGAAPTDTIKVKLACAGSIPGLPIDWAMNTGLAKKNGLDLECVQVQTGPALSAAMLAGQIDISGLTPANIYPLLDQGADMVAFQPVLDREYWDIVVRKDFPLPDAGQGWQGAMKDLQKARVGVVARGAAAEAVARGLYTEAGLDPDKATYIATGLYPTTLAALMNGSIDAAMVFEPGVTQALAQGAQQPFSIQELTGPKLMDWGSFFYSTTRKYAQQNPEVLKRFQKTYLEGLAEVRDPAKRADVEKFVTNELKLDPAVTTKVLDRNLPFFTDSKTMQPSRYDQVGDFFAKAGLSKKAYPVSAYAFNVNG